MPLAGFVTLPTKFTVVARPVQAQTPLPDLDAAPPNPLDPNPCSYCLPRPYDPRYLALLDYRRENKAELPVSGRLFFSGNSSAQADSLARFNRPLKKSEGARRGSARVAPAAPMFSLSLRYLSLFLGYFFLSQRGSRTG